MRPEQDLRSQMTHFLSLGISLGGQDNADNAPVQVPGRDMHSTLSETETWFSGACVYVYLHTELHHQSASEILVFTT